MLFFMRLMVNDVMSRRVEKCPYPSALFTPTYDNLTSADEVKLHQLCSLYIIIPNIFSNLHCDKNNDLFSEYEKAARSTIVCHRLRTPLHRVKQSAVYRHLMTPSWAILLITSHVPNA